ncbi:MAG: YbaB/EbfC family nucleoid-associated protein [Kutzneria sp.]|nr:YbaB/EbfC family nucleoid-associated protein [Kutzneria sp.]
MDDRRWGFDEADDWEADGAASARGADADTQDVVTGTDPDTVVTVTLTPAAEVVSVKLAADWRRSVDPRALDASVLAAVNAATMRALARQVEAVPPVAEVRPPAPSTPGGADEPPLTRQDVLRLVDAVSTDLRRFSERISPVVDHPVSAESAGGHVTATASRGRVIGLSLDPGWVGSVRDSEIESELLDVLRQLHDKSTPAELTAGPRSSAIAELTALASDPQRFLARLGLPL